MLAKSDFATLLIFVTFRSLKRIWTYLYRIWFVWYSVTLLFLCKHLIQSSRIHVCWDFLGILTPARLLIWKKRLRQLGQTFNWPISRVEVFYNHCLWNRQPWNVNVLNRCLRFTFHTISNMRDYAVSINKQPDSLCSATQNVLSKHPIGRFSRIINNRDALKLSKMILEKTKSEKKDGTTSTSSSDTMTDQPSMLPDGYIYIRDYLNTHETIEPIYFFKKCNDLVYNYGFTRFW